MDTVGRLETTVGRDGAGCPSRGARVHAAAMEAGALLIPRPRGTVPCIPYSAVEPADNFVGSTKMATMLQPIADCPCCGGAYGLFHHVVGC